MINLKALSVLIILIIPTNIYADNKNMKIKLNPAQLKEENLAVLLGKRYSCRNFQNKILKIDDIATVLWATYGKKHDSLTQATRIIPSAGATYPLELYVVVGENCVDKLEAGVYRYLIEDHSLEFITKGDKRKELARACLGQNFLYEAGVSLVITAKFDRTTNHYGSRGQRYVYMEAGHASQNTYLAVTNLGLATCEVGAFDDDSVKRLLNLVRDCEPLSVMPIGYAERR
jgi:SagB-type dehydrogenase family enzyme